MDQVRKRCQTTPHTARLSSSTDGMYGNFAGRDASRGMAKQSFDLGQCLPQMKAPVTHVINLLEMLTPVDQPLDKLEDLQKDEM